MTFERNRQPEDSLRASIVIEPSDRSIDVARGRLMAAIAEAPQDQRPWFRKPWVRDIPTHRWRPQARPGIHASARLAVVLLVVLAVLLATLLAIGSRRTDLALPRADNGLIAFVGVARVAGELDLETHGTRVKRTDLYTVRQDGTGLRQLTETPEREVWPAFSPDGTRLAFWRQAESGGPPLAVIMDARTGAELVAVAAPVAEGYTGDSGLRWSPDGRTVMLEAWTEGVADWEPSSWTLDVGTSAWRQLTDRVDGPSAWSPDGAWLMVPSDGELFIVPAAALEAGPIHDPQAVGGRRLTTGGNHGWGAWSPDGSEIMLMARKPNEEGGGPVEILDVATRERTELVNPGCSPGWSRDGRSVAYVTGRRGDRDVSPNGTPVDTTAFAAWTLELGSSDVRSVGRAWFGPKLAPDGSQVLLDTSEGLFVRQADGTGQPTRLTPVGLWPAEHEFGYRAAEFVCGEMGTMGADWQAVP